MSRWFCMVCLLWSGQCLLAEENVPVSPEVSETEVYFYLGDFQAHADGPDWQHPHGDFLLGMGVLVPKTNYLDWGVDLMLVSSQYATPASVSGGMFTVVDEDMTLSTLGVNLAARLRYRLDDMTCYAGGGAGMYFSRLTLSASTLGFIGTHEETSNQPGAYLMAGFQWALDEMNALGLEYRRVYLSVSFTPVTAGSVDAGGEGIMLMYRFSY